MTKVWEQINNPGFKPVEFDGFRKLAINQMSILTGYSILPPGRMKRIKGGMSEVENEK